MKIDYKIISPSLSRGHIACSHKLFSYDNFYYCIHEEEIDKYKHINAKFIINPAGNIKSIAHDRNFILEHEKTGNIIMIDDDVTRMNTIFNRQLVELNSSQIDRFIQDMFIMAFEYGVGLWGVNLIQDPIAYSINTPFSFKHPILGPFCGHIIDNLRYDETLPLKEDYDFYLQKIDKYGAAIRANFINYSCDHFGKEGGCQTYRTDEREKEQMKLLREKWGSKLIRYNEKNPDSVNMRIRL